MRILIISAFFPPQNVIASWRPHSWAEHWSKQGHDVTVLTVPKIADAPAASQAKSGAYRVLEVMPMQPFAFLRRRRGRQKELVASQKTVTPRGEGLLKRVLRRSGFLSSVRWPDIYDLWIFPASRSVSHERFDVIVSTFGPPASLVLGAMLKKRLGSSCFWCCDFRDLWTQNSHYRGFPLIRWVEFVAEKILVSRADLLTTVSEPLAKSLKKCFPQKDVRVILNGYAGSDDAEPEKAAQRSAKTVIDLVYTGTLDMDLRDPRGVYHALKLLSPDEQQRFRVRFYGPNMNAAVDAASKFSLASAIENMGNVDRTAVLNAQKAADVLLIVDAPERIVGDGVLTGKVFEYLFSGKFVLAVGPSAGSELGRLLAKTGGGRALGEDVQAIAATLRQFLEDGVPSGVRDTNSLQEYRRETQAQKLLAVLLDSNSRL